MKIKVKVFFTLREKLGWKEKVIELSGNARVKDILEQLPAIKKEIEKYKNKGYSMIIMVNGRRIEFLRGYDTALQEGDEVSFFPPAAGG